MEIIFVLIIVLFVSWKIYEFIYYYTKQFKEIKRKIELHIFNCNDLNNYIEKLKASYVEIRQLDYGRSYYYDNSTYNYKRPKLKEQMYLPYVYTCSRTVCDNARKQPFKYICKYFNIKANEEWLNRFEKILNNYEAAEEGKSKLVNEKERIMQNIEKDIPFFIRHFSKKLSRKLGFNDIDLHTMYFPRFIFQYISSGGYASMQCDIIMDINNLNRFIQYLSDVIDYRKSVQGQRALMNSYLRQYILNRDNYTCKQCGNSTYNEPNLLLEVDHIIPISRGGLTTESNLQTLCWKCNRSKSNKIY